MYIYYVQDEEGERECDAQAMIIIGLLIAGVTTHGRDVEVLVGVIWDVEFHDRINDPLSRGREGRGMGGKGRDVLEGGGSDRTWAHRTLLPSPSKVL